MFTYLVIDPNHLDENLSLTGHLLFRYRPQFGMAPILVDEEDESYCEIDPRSLIVEYDSGMVIYSPRGVFSGVFSRDIQQWLEEHPLWGHPGSIGNLEGAARWKESRMDEWKESFVEGFKVAIDLIEELMFQYHQPRRQALKVSKYYASGPLNKWILDHEDPIPDCDLDPYNETLHKEVTDVQEDNTPEK